MTDSTSAVSGHRARLRSRFLSSPEEMTEAQLVELLLTYAIPRQDVEKLAMQLLIEFGDIEGLLNASRKQLLGVEGIGETTATLIQLVAALLHPHTPKSAVQPGLFNADTAEETTPAAPVSDPQDIVDAPDQDTDDEDTSESDPATLRAFVNDEIANIVNLLPYAAQFPSVEEYRRFLWQKLPYNSETTRRRRANHIIDRFFPNESVQISLQFFLSQKTSRQSLHDVIFYHVLKAEQLAEKVAEEFVWPALPLGRVDREDLRSYILEVLPHLSKSSQKNTLRSLLTAYDLLGVGQVNQGKLYFRTHYGTLDSFVYILLAECPTPGIYGFSVLENGPMHRWLLWDQQWMRRQLYNLRDLGILTKVSEIDTVRQFSLALPQYDALARYFAIDEGSRLALREEPIGSMETPTKSRITK